MASNNETVTNLLAEIREPLMALQQEQQELPIDHRQNLIKDFMSGLYKLGLKLYQDTSLRSSTEMKHFTQEAQNLLLMAVPSILSYIGDTEDIFYSPWEYDEWTRVSKRRSAIEFLREIFSNTSFGEFLSIFNTDNIDKMFSSKEEQGGYLPVDVVPDGIPSSHWWWWYPDVPPSSEKGSSRLNTNDDNLSTGGD